MLYFCMNCPDLYMLNSYSACSWCHSVLQANVCDSIMDEWCQIFYFGGSEQGKLVLWFLSHSKIQQNWSLVVAGKMFYKLFVIINELKFEYTTSGEWEQVKITNKRCFIHKSCSSKCYSFKIFWFIRFKSIMSLIFIFSVVKHSFTLVWIGWKTLWPQNYILTLNFTLKMMTFYTQLFMWFKWEFKLLKNTDGKRLDSAL